MPKIPTVTPPIIGPSQTATVRADPNMYQPLGAAGARLGQALENVGEVGMDLATRVKHATDAAYVVGANATLEKATQDFHTWTLDHPDTGDWQQELDKRMGDAKNDVLKGADNLNRFARQQLTTDLGSWEKRTAAGFNHASTEQNLKNAAGTLDATVNFASANLDKVGAFAAIDTGVAHGVFSAARGEGMKKQVGATIAFNQATNEIADYAKGFAETINEKDGSGNFINHPDLQPKAREILFKSAVKTASDNRTLQLEKWRQQAADVQAGTAEPPDMNDVKTIADHLGIPPKVAEKVFVPATAFNADGYNKVTSAIAAADVHDLANPNSQTKGHLIEQVYAAHLPAHAQEELFRMIDKRSDPKSEYNTPVFKDVMQANDQNFKLGLYGKYETKVKGTLPNETKTVVNPTVLRQAQETKAKVTDAVVEYLQKNPQATYKDVTKYMSTVYRKTASQAGTELFKFNP